MGLGRALSDTGYQPDPNRGFAGGDAVDHDHAAVTHDARHRIAGYLFAWGFRDRVARETVLRELTAQLGERAETRANLGVVESVARVQAWFEDLLNRTAGNTAPHDPARLAAKQWLTQRLPALLVEHPDAFTNPQVVADAARSELRDPDDRQGPAAPPPLPKAHPMDMPRQPLGDLPVVLRGSFWVSTARWAWPQRLRRSQSRDAALLANPEQTGH